MWWEAGILKLKSICTLILLISVVTLVSMGKAPGELLVLLGYVIKSLFEKRDSSVPPDVLK